MKKMWERVDVYDEIFHMLMLTLSDKHGHNFGMYVLKSWFVWNALVLSGNKISLQSSQESLWRGHVLELIDFYI